MCREQAQRALRALFLARQPHGAARAGAAAHRRARRRPDAELHARACHHRAVGGRRARAGLRRPRPARGQRWCAPRKRHRRRAAMPSWIALYVETRRGLPCRRPSVAGSPRRCGWPSSSAPRSSPCPAARCVEEILAFAAARATPRAGGGRQAASARAGSSCATGGSVVDELVRSASARISRASGAVRQRAPTRRRPTRLRCSSAPRRRPAPIFEGRSRPALAIGVGMLLDNDSSCPTSRWSSSCRS